MRSQITSETSTGYQRYGKQLSAGRLPHWNASPVRKIGFNSLNGQSDGGGAHFDDEFEEAKAALAKAVREAIQLSRSLAGRYAVPPRRGWATALFARMCVTGTSILRLVPTLKRDGPEDHWDFTAIATLTRNLLEAHLQLFYFGIENVSEPEWLLRKHLIDLHDAVSRLRLFEGMAEAEREDDPEQVLAFVRSRLTEDPLFLALPESRQRHFLTGKHAWFLTQDEILERMGGDQKTFRFQYRFLSAQSHTLPLAFHRMFEGEHGRGIENEREKFYIAYTLDLAAETLQMAIGQMQGLFKDWLKPA